MYEAASSLVNLINYVEISLSLNAHSISLVSCMVDS
jgi:hypothetical protein